MPIATCSLSRARVSKDEGGLRPHASRRIAAQLYLWTGNGALCAAMLLSMRPSEIDN
jgi:hypothetical protein